jgi:hypothetical protein
MGSGLTLVASLAFCHDEDLLRGAILVSCGSGFTLIICSRVSKEIPTKGSTNRECALIFFFLSAHRRRQCEDGGNSEAGQKKSRLFEAVYSQTGTKNAV